MEWRVTIGIALAVSSISSFVPIWFAMALLHSLTHSFGDYWLSVVILVLVSKSAFGDFRKKDVRKQYPIRLIKILQCPPRSHPKNGNSHLHGPDSHPTSSFRTSTTGSFNFCLFESFHLQLH